MVAFGHCVSYKTGKDWSKKTAQHQLRSLTTLEKQNRAKDRQEPCLEKSRFIEKP